MLNIAFLGGECRMKLWKYLFVAMSAIMIQNGMVGARAQEVTEGEKIEDKTNIQSYASDKKDVSPIVESKGVQITKAYISSVDTTGYTVSATVNSDSGISKVQIPVWTKKNGQDDLVWHQAEVINDHIEYHVNIKDHKYEDGIYITHLYAYDNAGKMAMTVLNEITVKKTPIKLSSVKITSKDATGYTVEADVVSDYGIKQVKIPVWTKKNGQDDLIWHQAEVLNNHIKYHVNIKDHKYEDGDYITHLYVYDNAGSMAMTVLNKTTIKKTPIKLSSVKITSKDATGYTVEADVVSDYGIKQVKIPVWTKKNGQDDLIWHQAEVLNNHIKYHVNIKDHKYEDGDYITHLYVYDNAGSMAMTVLNETAIKKTPVQIKQARVINKDGTGYMVEAIIVSDYGIKKVQLPTWTYYRGQDDLVWYNGAINGNRVTFRVRINDHLFEQGNYISHLYAYDNAGGYSMMVFDPISITPNFNPGFNEVNGDFIYVNSDGSVASGFVDVGNDCYYYEPATKKMVRGSKVINGRNFVFNWSNGKLESMTAKIPYFSQIDSRWAYKRYGNYYFANTGCVPTSGAMIFSFLNRYITPDQMGNWAYSHGYLNHGYVFGCTDGFWPAYSKATGRYYKGNLSMNQAIMELKHGRILAAAMNPGTFTHPGTTHEIVIYGIDKNNMVQVYDPLYKEHNGKYHISTIFKQLSTDRTDKTSGGPVFAIG